MCNAWNHPPNCTCGWGGTGHKGKVKFQSRPINVGVPPIHLTYNSFVIPNALCPKCGQHVFFYQSPNGGRVFFDELGPPWPKHPCTDGQSLPRQIEASALARKYAATRTYGWQKDEWVPFFVNSVTRVDLYTLRIIGSTGLDIITLFVTSRLKRHGQFELITSSELIHVRPCKGKRYDVSIFYEGKNFVGFLYLSELAARNGDNLNDIYLEKKPTGKLKKYVPKQHSSIEKDKVSLKNSAMRLAMENAIKGR